MAACKKALSINTEMYLYISTHKLLAKEKEKSLSLFLGRHLMSPQVSKVVIDDQLGNNIRIKSRERERTSAFNVIVYMRSKLKKAEGNRKR